MYEWVFRLSLFFLSIILLLIQSIFNKIKKHKISIINKIKTKKQKHLMIKNKIINKKKKILLAADQLVINVNLKGFIGFYIYLLK